MNAPSTACYGFTFRLVSLDPLRVESRPAHRTMSLTHVGKREPWRRVGRAELLAYPLHSTLWAWLREQGATRPSPSGPSGTNSPESARATVGKVRLTARAERALGELAAVWGTSRQETVERALVAALCAR